jgi:molybdopterin converting factor small subunit
MKVLIPTPLRQYAEKKSTIEVSADTVGEALEQLTQAHPDLKKHLFNDAGQLRAFVNIYLNDEDVRYLEKDKTPVVSTDTLSIVPSIAGGIKE